MSKPRDPVIAVLKYFQTADLALAQQALALAQQTLKARIAPALRPKPRPVPKTAVAAGDPGA